MNIFVIKKIEYLKFTIGICGYVCLARLYLSAIFDGNGMSYQIKYSSSQVIFGCEKLTTAVD